VTPMMVLVGGQLQVSFRAHYEESFRSANRFAE
jgi:hypothetical protein